MEVELVVCGPRADLGDEDVPVRRLADARDYDLAIATWWTTAEALFELEAQRRVALLAESRVPLLRRARAGRPPRRDVRARPAGGLHRRGVAHAGAAERSCGRRRAWCAWRPGSTSRYFAKRRHARARTTARAGGGAADALVQGGAGGGGAGALRGGGGHGRDSRSVPGGRRRPRRGRPERAGDGRAVRGARRAAAARALRGAGTAAARGVPRRRAVRAHAVHRLGGLRAPRAQRARRRLRRRGRHGCRARAAARPGPPGAPARGRARDGARLAGRGGGGRRVCQAPCAAFLEEPPPPPDEALRRMASTRRLATELTRPLVGPAAEWKDAWAEADRKNAEYDAWARQLQSRIETLQSRPGYRVERRLKRLWSRS